MIDENETLDFPRREYKRGRIRIRIHLVSLPLLIAQCSLNSTNFLSKYRSCKRPSCSDPVVTVALIIKWLQTEHNYAFWDLWYCWKTFQSRHLYKQLYRNWRTTLAHPTSWQLYQVRSWTSWAWRSKYFFHYSRSIHWQIVAVTRKKTIVVPLNDEFTPMTNCDLFYFVLLLWKYMVD